MLSTPGDFLCLLAGVVVLFTHLSEQSTSSVQVVYAVNAGGSDHTDKHGIHYESDPLQIGIASDFGNNLLMIGRVPEHDEVLYRTERYHTATFGYELHADGDGDYALIMKFCEVYFREPQKKVFDIVLNNKHTIVSQLDIFREVGHGTAHEELVLFKISEGRLHFNGETSDVRNGRLRLDFIKGKFDNPKINAFALLKGDVKNLPRLPPLSEEVFDAELIADGKARSHHNTHKESPVKIEAPKKAARYTDDDNEDDDDDEIFEEDDVEEPENLPPLKQDTQKSSRKTSGPRQPNPYLVDDSSVLLPVFIAIGAFIPLLFCLCKL